MDETWLARARSGSQRRPDAEGRAGKEDRHVGTEVPRRRWRVRKRAPAATRSDEAGQKPRSRVPALAAQQDGALALLGSMPDAAFALDAGGHLTFLSPAWEALTGMPAAEALGRPLASLARQRDALELELGLASLAAGKARTWRGTCRVPKAEGGELCLEVHAAAYRPSSGDGVERVVGTMRDVTSQHAQITELTRRTLHDPLLGIPNRCLLLDRLERRCARASRRPWPPFALAFLDLDDFKLINDAHGHAIGDEALRAAARRLAGAVRPSDTVARIGGDEFAVLFDEVSGAREAVGLALRLRQMVGRPLALEGRDVDLACSVGVVTSDVAFERVEELLEHSDAAIYAAKRSGLGVALFGSADRRPRRKVWRGDARLPSVMLGANHLGRRPWR